MAMLLRELDRGPAALPRGSELTLFNSREGLLGKIRDRAKLENISVLHVQVRMLPTHTPVGWVSPQIRFPTVQPLRGVQPDAVCGVGSSIPDLSFRDLGISPWGRPNRENCTLAEEQQTHRGRPFQSA